MLTLLLVACSTLACSASTSQKPPPASSEPPPASSEPKPASSEPKPASKTEPSGGDVYAYAGDIALPGFEGIITDFAVSEVHKRLFARDGSDLRLYNLSRDFRSASARTRVPLVDAESRLLKRPTRMSYDERLQQLFVLSETGVHRFDAVGTPLGDLPVPDQAFKPREIAFDAEGQGTYVLSCISGVCNLFYWETPTTAPVIRVQGSLDRQFEAIGSAALSTSRAFWAYDFVAKSLVLRALTDSGWKTDHEIAKANGLSLATPARIAQRLNVHVMDGKAIHYYQPGAAFKSTKNLLVGSVTVPESALKSRAALTPYFMDYELVWTDLLLASASGKKLLLFKK